MAEELSITAASKEDVERGATEWKASLRPGGKLVLSFNDEALAADAKLPLLLEGFVVANSSSTIVVATKPEWEAGAKVKVDLSDLVDEDDLLAADGLEPPPVPDDVGCSARKPCANCTCGRADAMEEAPKPKPAAAVSECGNCAKGDAFRCAGCPFLGKPAFKPGEEALILEMTDDL